MNGQRFSLWPFGSSGDLEAPSSVQEGSTSPIEVIAPGASHIRVAVLATGESFDVAVENGVARFELPAGAVAGTTLSVVDRDNFEDSALISVTPATGAS